LYRFLSYFTLMILKSGLEVTQGHSKWYHSKAWVRFPIRLPYGSILQFHLLVSFLYIVAADPSVELFAELRIDSEVFQDPCTSDGHLLLVSVHPGTILLNGTIH